MGLFRVPDQERDQQVLFSQKLDDAVSKRHPVRAFDRILRDPSFGETFSKMRSAYHQGNDGRPAFDPFYLTMLVIYGGLARVRSSRQLQAACKNRIDFMWLMEGQAPDYTTICQFLNRHGKDFDDVFKATIKVALDAKVLKPQHIAVDGSKIEAAASPASMTSVKKLKDRKQLIEAKVAEIKASIEANDKIEAKTGESALLATELAKDEKSLQRKMRKIDAALEANRERQEAHAKRDGGGQAPAACASTTDPQARLMRDKEGRTKPNYTTQIALDPESAIIAANAVSDQPCDGGVLPEMIQQATENMGQSPAQVSADSAYNVGPAIAQLENQGIETFIPDSGKSLPATPEHVDAVSAARRGDTLSAGQIETLLDSRTKRISNEAFRFDTASKTCMCPAGKPLRYVRTSPDKKAGHTVDRMQFKSGENDCAACPLKTFCIQGSKKVRMTSCDEYEPQRERLRQRMATTRGRSEYKKRSSTERGWSWIKCAYGLRKFTRRGFKGARTELTLACTAHNLRILVALKAG